MEGNFTKYVGARDVNNHHDDHHIASRSSRLTMKSSSTLSRQINHHIRMIARRRNANLRSSYDVTSYYGVQLRHYPGDVHQFNSQRRREERGETTHLHVARV